MDEVLTLLKSLDERMARLEQRFSEAGLGDLLAKAHYSCAEVANLTTLHGTKKAKPFTVRLACRDGRIPEARKDHGGQWLIPKEGVIRILSEGIPPERR